MEKKKPEKIIFQTVRLDDLVEVVDLKQLPEQEIFKEWFNFQHSISVEEEKFLQDLIKDNYDFLSYCSEEDLKMEFIALLLAKVRFRFKDKRGFYEQPLKAKINGVEFCGKTDFMFAMGVEVPQKPYFFIQEFKREGKSSHPKNQLLAEMLVAIELNKVNLMRGAYIVGRHWNFVMLEKIAENSFQYFVSDSFDSLNFKSLRHIYNNLQAIKLVYCV